MQPKKNNNTPVMDIDNMQRKVAQGVNAPLTSTDALLQFLMSWWCRRYNKPYKCAEILEYTFEELLFEYFDINFRENPQKLKEYLEGGDKELEEANDEAWFEKMMGDKYISKEEQEKKVAASKTDAIKNMTDDDDEFSYEFGEYR